MPDPKPHLSYEEFVAILQGAATLQTSTADRYGKDELLSAARELQLDPAAVSELVDAYVTRREALELSPRPFDTRIELHVEPAMFQLTVPPLRCSLRAISSFGFVAVWFAGIAFWTHGALQSGALFAAFSIPFWAVGISLAVRVASPLLQTTRLVLNREVGTLQASPLGRSRTLRTSEVGLRIGNDPRYASRGESEGQPVRALLLEFGTKTFPLLSGYSDQEQRWIENQLRSWLLAYTPAFPGVAPGAHSARRLTP